MDGLLKLFQAVLDLFKAPYKAMLAVLLLSAAAIFLPSSLAARMRVDGLLQVHRVTEWGAFLFAALYLVFFAFERLWCRIEMLKHFQNLPEDERLVIRSFMEWKSRTKGLISSAATAQALVKLGALEPGRIPNPNNLKAKRGDSFFTMKPWVFRYFKKRPKLYAAAEPERAVSSTWIK